MTSDPVDSGRLRELRGDAFNRVMEERDALLAQLEVLKEENAALRGSLNQLGSRVAGLPPCICHLVNGQWMRHSACPAHGDLANPNTYVSI